MSLARKLALLVAVPLLAVVAYAAFTLYTAVEQAVSADELKAEVGLAGTADRLIQDLHQERVASLDLVVPKPPAAGATAFRDLATRTDAVVALYRGDRGAVSSVPQHLVAVLDRIDRGLDDLPGLRDQVLNGRGTNLSTITFRYRILAADLQAYRSGVASGAPIEVADQLRAASLLTQIAEDTGLQEIAVLRAHDGGLTPAVDQDIQAERSDAAEVGREFSEVAPAQWRAWYDKSRTGPAAQAAQIIDDEVARTPTGERLQIDPDAWRTAMDAKIGALGRVEQQVDDAVMTSVVDYRDNQLWLAAGLGAAVLVVLALAIGIAIRLGAPMIRGLRGLRTAAHAVAYERLPAAVARLSKRNALGAETPEQFAARQGDAVRVTGGDEIAQVGAALNEMNHSALHLAAQQAVLRDQVDAIFVALARRAERLTAALIAQVDAVELGERDPERLAQLFMLDNLATRMRRTNNSLLVLGGEPSAKVRTEPMTCNDLLNAATAQVERYQQVKIVSEVEALALMPEASDDIAHLLAELVDNATTFSAPGSPVLVRAIATDEHVVVTVTDRGIGLPPDALAAANARIANPVLDVAAVRAMGMTVVGHIASWYDVRVELRSVADRSARNRGTVAVVLLPYTVFRRDANFDWFHARRRGITTALKPPTPPKPPENTADRRDAAEVSGVMTAFARGIGAHRPVAGGSHGAAKPGERS